MYPLLEFTDVAVFEVASDAFLSFKARTVARVGEPLECACCALVFEPNRLRWRLTGSKRSQELLTRHGALTTAFLLENSTQFFKEFNTKLLLSKNYVTKRQSLKVRDMRRSWALHLLH